MSSYDYKGDLSIDRGPISIKTDISDCMKFFDGLDVNRNQIQSRLMRTTGQGAVIAARRGFGKTLRNRTGNLKRHITYVMGDKGSRVTIYSDANSGKATSGVRTSRRLLTYGISHEHRRIARYGFMLAKGFTAGAATSWGMRFQVGGRWVTVRTLRVAPKDWLEPPVIRYADSYDLHNRLEKELQKQIDYWEKRITGENLK